MFQNLLSLISVFQSYEFIAIATFRFLAVLIILILDILSVFKEYLKLIGKVLLVVVF